MNLCFVLGKIISDVNFDFILNGKHDSIASFRIKLLNGSEVNVVAYDDSADYCYRALAQNNIIYIYGSLNSKFTVIVKWIFKY